MTEKTTKNRRLPLIIIGAILGVVLLACIGCFALGAITASSPEYKATATARAIAQATEAARPSDTPAPTNTSGPTATPEPSSTPKPTDTPAPTATPTLPPAGESRDNPVPAGTTVDIGGNMTLTIVGAIRPADDTVRRANMFNTKPEAGQEYVEVDIQVVCNKSSSDKCYFAASEIKAVGADGNVREAELFIAGVDGLLESGEFFGGATRTGKMFFIVGKDDKSVVLFYDPLLFGDTIYLALP